VGERKRKVVRVPDWGKRDVGKIFLLTEWSAERAEHWAWRALIAYNRGGGQIPPEVLDRGMEAIFWVGINTFLRGQMQASEVIPIMDELLECVQIIRDETKRDVATRQPVAHPLLPDDIAEVKTRLWLRSEVLRLHTDFSPGDFLSNLISVMAERTKSPDTQTSPL
jgi:hypothetical protein